MHKYITKFFELLKNLIQLLKILTIFSILMLLLNWIQHLTNDNWAWTNFMNPLLNSFINIGNLISDKSITLCGAIFEYKYLFALILFLALYALWHFSYIGLCTLQDGYEVGRMMVKKAEEDKFNNDLEKSSTSEQKKIQQYQIYINAAVKKKFQSKDYNIDLEEQKKQMNKFLMEKLGTTPKSFQDGFLYSFSQFSHIDDVLEVFFKTIKSETPLDYMVCVQIVDPTVSGYDTNDKLRQLVSLKIENNICMLAETAYRYSFNPTKKYDTLQVGLFQKGSATFEVQQFVER